MNPLDIKYSRSASRFAVIAILVFVAVSLAAVVSLRAQGDATDDGIAASIRDYLAQSAEALGW